MRNMTKWFALVAVSVALLVASAATDAQGQDKGQRKGGGKGGGFGQFGGGFGGGGQNMAGLLGNPGVQTELKMTDDQKSKAGEFAQEQQAKQFEAFRAGGAGGPPDAAALAKTRKEANQAAEKFAKDNLKADQAKRLKGIYYQNQTLLVLTEDEDVQKELNLTADQKSKLKAHNDKLTADRTELGAQLRGGGGDFAAIGEKMTALTKDHTDKAVAELTAAQKTKWKDLTGEPFVVQPGRGRRGGGDE